MKLSFFDMLGIDPALADRATAAAALWPDNLVSLTPGINVNHSDPLTIVNQLFQGTTFASLRPGVDAGAFFGTGTPGQLGFAADMHVVGPFVTAAPFYLRAMPDLGIQLSVTDPLHPARVFFAVDGRGHEIIIDRLPVKIFLKAGIASALSGAPVSVARSTRPRSTASPTPSTTTRTRPRSTATSASSSPSRATSSSSRPCRSARPGALDGPPRQGRLRYPVHSLAEPARLFRSGRTTTSARSSPTRRPRAR